MNEKFRPLEETLKAPINESKESLSVGEVIDIDQIALFVEQQANAKDLGTVLRALEKSILSGNEASDRIKEPKNTKLRQGVAKTVELILNSLDFFEQQSIDVSLGLSDAPEGVLLEDFDQEAISSAIELIGDQAFSYVELIREHFSPEELTESQRSIFGFSDEETNVEELSPVDLESFFNDHYSDILSKMGDEDDFFDPRKPYVGAQSATSFLQSRVNYFRELYTLDYQSDTAKRAEIIALIEKYIEPAEDLIPKLIEREADLEGKELEEWKVSNPKYSDLNTELKEFEDKTNGIPLDGSGDVTPSLTKLNKLVRELSEEIDSNEKYKENIKLFEEIGLRSNKIKVELQIALYLFLTRQLSDEISRIEELDRDQFAELTPNAKNDLFENIKALRKDGNKDILQNSYFSSEVSAKFGVVEDAQNEAYTIAGDLRTKYDKVLDRLGEIGETSISLEYMRGLSLSEAIGEWHTNDVSPDGEERHALQMAYKEKLKDLKKGFIEHSLSKGLSQAEAEKEYENFSKLYDDAFGLVWFGIFNGKGVNTTQGTAKHEAILEGAGIKNAMNTNAEFNMNPLVGSVGEELHQGEMYMKPFERNKKDEDGNFVDVDGNPLDEDGHPLGVDGKPVSNEVRAFDTETISMGIIQKIVFAAFQEMKRRGKGADFCIDKGYETDDMTKLIDYVCGLDDITMWDANDKKVHTDDKMPMGSILVGQEMDIAKDLSAFPQEVIDIIKQVATWKICRDDLGSKAGIWHWGRNKGAFKFEDGVSSSQADGWMGGQSYKVGKNTQKQGHLASLGFITPENTDFITGIHQNDQDILDGIEKMDRYYLYKFPQLRGFMFEDSPPEDGMIESFYKHSPENWWEDYPGLDHFFNQTDRKATSGNYDKSRKAVFKIIEMATESVYEKVPNNQEDLETYLNAIITSFDTQIGIALAYIGKFDDRSEDYLRGGEAPEDKKPNELNYVHGLILAAMKFYLTNVLVRIPTHIKLKRTIPVVDTLPIPDIVDRDYHSNYRVAQEVLDDIISRNSTMATFYSRELTGVIGYSEDDESLTYRGDRNPDKTWTVKPFLKHDFKARFRDETKMGGRYRRWLVKKKNDELERKNHSKMNWQDRDKIRLGVIDAPYHFKIGSFTKAEKGQIH